MTWRKSKHSEAGNCIEVNDDDWRKASYSNPSGNCVEVGQGVLVRDTQQVDQRDRVVLQFTGAAWDDFLQRIQK